MTKSQQGVLVVAIAIAAVLDTWGLRLMPESSPAERGAAAARAHGCIDCHGKPGPEFPDDANLACGRAADTDTHPLYEGQCSDVLAYFEVVRLKRTFEARVANSGGNHLLEGEKLARQFNCFQCHGELGQGGFQNAGSLKGYIPGYFGRDFALLTQGGNSASVRTWISQGIDPSLFSSPIEGPIARFFIVRQEISMPVFESLPDSTIQTLADYVIELNQLGAMDAKAIRHYGDRTQETNPAGPSAWLGAGELVVK